jgi:hypothetical protein
MIYKLKKYCYELIILLCIIFVLVYGIYSKIKGVRGTWSKQLPSIGGVNYNIGKTFRTNNGYNINNHDIDYYTINHINDNNTSIPQKFDSKGEMECRKCLVEIFGKPFNKSRPDFLRNPVTGGMYNLELDCYNEDLKLAVEYNGIQHYKYTPFFHKTQDSLLIQKYKDDMKKRICKENGIVLIEVPYTIKLDKIKEYIVSQLILNKKLMIKNR